MNNKIIYFLLAVIVFVTVFNSFRGCSQEKKLDSVYEKQIAAQDSLTNQIERIAKSRVDSSTVIERQIPIIINNATEQQHEVYITNNADSVIMHYYSYRPEQIN
jgi:hypothetical protein